VIAISGCLSVIAYVLFILLPFFIPNTDLSRFPPYLALPESGFSLSSYYGLYLFIFLNAMVIFGLYLLSLRTVSRPGLQTGAGTGDSERLAKRIIAFSAVFHLMMLATPFLLSTDIFDYIRHGRILAVYGENPLLVPATYFPQDPFFGLGGWVGTGSVYGSLHVYVTAALSRLAGDGFVANFMLFRGFFVALDVVNVVLIWKLARRLVPGFENRALLFYGWNPFMLTLVVAGAHNDILMLTLVLAGFLLYLEKKPTLGLLLMALATLVKFIALPILVVYLALLIRRQQGALRRTAYAAVSVTLCAVVFVVSYLPLWAGRETFGYLAIVGQKTNFTISGLITGTIGDHLSLSNSAVQLALGALLGAYILWHVLGVRNTEGLISAAAGIAFLTPFVLFWFQPWYLTLALGIIALRPWRIMYTAALVFSFSVMFFDGFWWHAPVSMDIQMPLRVLVVFGPPIALLVVLKGREVLPGAGRRLLSWTLEQAGSRPGTQEFSDPSGVRLIVEVGVLAIAALVPMAITISASPRLSSLSELLLLKLKLLVS
jgi:hypothetical protein